MTDILVIGSGPAGYTAAIYGSRAGRSVKLIAGGQPGGQLTITSLVENYPGFADPVSGPELTDQMRRQCEKVGTEIIYDTIKSVDFSRRPFVCTGESGAFYESRTVVIATGANAKWLGVPGEEKYRGTGVSACATCDGFFFRNKTVAVIGGGNSAVEEAIYLTNFAEKVILIHRRDQLRAEKIMRDRLSENPKIEIMWNKRVAEISGDGGKVTELLLADVEDGSETVLRIDGVFVAVGHRPATSVFEGVIEIDENGYIVTKGVCTSTEGVFAAGDVCDPRYRQAIVSAAQGCMAAMDADKFLSANL
ncbi:MAG: thioredoxin-disulfide reductase [Holosporaceae bacterium]|jgi:thioredoxin reductase (NADPH)|nr:thioredoxin-disulfide reductase [Holosporaceae bacterium]